MPITEPFRVAFSSSVAVPARREGRAIDYEFSSNAHTGTSGIGHKRIGNRSVPERRAITSHDPAVRGGSDGSPLEPNRNQNRTEKVRQPNLGNYV